jgi:hypothetical protein
MHPKLKTWFELKAKRLIELKIKGGSELFKKDKDPSKFNLDPNELSEFLTLSGQMDGVIWALQPDSLDEKIEFFQNFKKFFATIEEECYTLKEITGKTSIPKGRA